MFRPLVLFVTTPPERGHQLIVDTIDAVTAVDGVNAADLENPLARWRAWRRRDRSLVHVIAGPGLEAAAGLAQQRGIPLVVTVPKGWRGTVPESAALVVANEPISFDPARLRVIELGVGTTGARAADLEEQWVSLARSGTLVPTREPLRSSPPVSIVVVTYNRADLLKECLEALDAQSYSHRELCVVDNASTDGTRELLAGRPDITVIRYDQHKPVVEARNEAVARLSGELICFTDDDCRPTNHWVRSLVGAFSDGIGIVQGKTVSDPRADVGPLSRTQVMPAEAGLYETCNIAYRRSLFEQVGAFDTAFASVVERTLGKRIGKHPFGEDTELAWRAKEAGAQSRFASDAVVEHHVFPANPPYLLKRAVVSSAFPVLLKRTPELRRELLTAGFFLGSRRALWWLAVLGGVLSFLTPWTLLLTLPYLRRMVAPQKPRRWRRIRVLPFQVIRDGVESAALLYGSIRARRLVL